MLLAAASIGNWPEAIWKCEGLSLQTQPRSPSAFIEGNGVDGRGFRPNCMFPEHSEWVQGLLSPRSDGMWGLSIAIHVTGSAEAVSSSTTVPTQVAHPCSQEATGRSVPL
jgi:hypothetical protein